MSDKIQEIMNMPEFDLQNFSVIGTLLCKDKKNMFCNAHNIRIA